MKSDLIDLTLYVLRTSSSGKAIEVRDAPGADRVWLPLSEIEVEPLRDGSGLSIVTMPRWIAREKGLIL